MAVVFGKKIAVEDDGGLIAAAYELFVLLIVGGNIDKSIHHLGAEHFDTPFFLKIIAVGVGIDDAVTALGRGIHRAAGNGMEKECRYRG